MFTFKPGIWRSGSWYELPRPIASVRVLDSWDYAQFKVPLAAGDHVEGRSANGVDIAIEGETGTQAGDVCASEAAMFQEIEALRTALGGTGAFELFLYHDSASGTYRSFRECTTVRFEYDLSEPQLYRYSVVIHAADPTIYSAAPS
jgi:hypothetical protein